jgi:metallo-beta-lactamase class B
MPRIAALVYPGGVRHPDSGPRRGACARRATAALLAALATGATSRAADEAEAGQRLATDLIVRRLTPGVWMHVSFPPEGPGRATPANGLVIATGEKSVLVDTGWSAGQTRLLLDWAENVLRQPVVHLILTHSHPDRTGGLAAVLERPIIVHGHTLTAELLKENDRSQVQWSFEFEERLELGHDSIFLLYPGPGHAPDNIVVWLPRQRTLFAGCLVRSVTADDLGNTGDADLARWPVAVRRVIERYREARILVPGHGPVGGPELLSHTMELLERANGHPLAP